MNRKKEETISKPDYRQTYQRGRLRVEFSPASSDCWLWDVKYFYGQRLTYVKKSSLLILAGSGRHEEEELKV